MFRDTYHDEKRKCYGENKGNLNLLFCFPCNKTCLSGNIYIDLHHAKGKCFRKTCLEIYPKKESCL